MQTKMEHKNEAGRRSLFCCHYARLGDVAEAARCAGYPAEHAAAEGAALLRQASCRRMVEAYRSALQGDPAAIVRAGLERLAFGRTNDVIQLLLAEEPMTGQQIQALERELGFKLFERRNRSFTPTPAGEYFYRKSLVLTADYERMCRDASKIANGDQGGEENFPGQLR